MKKFRLLSVVLALVCAVSFFGFNFGAVNEVKAENVYELHYWEFEDSLNDAAGTYAFIGEAAYAEGKNGKAIDIAGMDKAVRTDKLTCDTCDGYTLGAWIKLNDTATGFNIILAHGNTGSGQADRFQIHIADASPEKGGGDITVYAPGVSDGAFGGGIPESLILFDTWTHVATTFNGNLAKVFVNGTKIMEIEIAGQLEKSVDAYQKITVGALSDMTQLKFDGLIDDAFYANYAMTEADVAAAAAADGNVTLKAWADGSRAFTPDEMKGYVAPEPVTGEAAEEKTSGHVFYWPFDNDYIDLSHKEFDFDYDEMYPDFTEGKLGQAVLLEDVSIRTDAFPEDLDLSNFTLSFWVRFDGIPNALPYYILTAFGDKAEHNHFETYLISLDCEEASLCIYDVSSGSAADGISAFSAGEFANVIVTNSKTTGAKIYCNGELVYKRDNPFGTVDLADGIQCFTLGALQDYSLPCYGAYDEVVLADYVLSDNLVAKLYADPQGASDDIKAIVKANAPEDYARPTAKPTAEPTEVPTAAPATEVPAATEASTPASATKAPESKDNAGKKDNNAALIIIIAAAVVVVAIIIAIIMILKKKKK